MIANEIEDVTQNNAIRHQSVTCNRIIYMSTGSPFLVLTHDQTDRRTKSMLHWSLRKVRDPVTRGVT